MKGSTIAVIVVLIVAIVASGAYLATGSLSGHTTSTSSTQQPSTVTLVQTTSLTATTSIISTATSTATSVSTSVVTTTASSTTSTTTSSSNTTNSINLVRIGYFANLNHGPAVLGLSNGDFQKFLGPTTSIKTYLFTAGPTEMTALLAGQIDMAYVGPSPAVNAFIQSNGTALKIVAGVASGGAVFVVRNASNINSIKDLGGKTFAAPQLGNTQDIALRSFLLRNGFRTTDQGGNVTVEDTSNSNIVTLMVQGKLDGAWVPEPYASILIYTAACHVFVDERSLWPNGQFSTAELVVSSSFLKAHADVVKKIIAADVFETRYIMNNTGTASAAIDKQIGNLTNTTPTNSTIFSNAMTYLSFAYDPLETSVAQQAQNAYVLGFLGSSVPNLNGLFDLTLLNQVLQEQGLTQISG